MAAAKQFGGAKGYSGLHFQVIIDYGEKSGQKGRKKPRNNAGLCSPSLYNQNHLPRDGATHSSWACPILREIFSYRHGLRPFCSATTTEVLIN